jgi:hypothetical protein
MANYHSMPDGGKGYKPPYPGHEAMCAVRKSEGKNTSSSLVGTKKVTEGRKPELHDRSTKSTSAHGKRGYQAAKVKHK